MPAHPAAALPAALLALLHGTVTIGPVTPVCRVGVPCDKPAASVVLTFTDGARVFRTTTHADGTYGVRLAPAAYTVRASAGMRISPFKVIVRKGSRAQPFSIDTGIR
jgi:hypothetical protein